MGEPGKITRGKSINSIQSQADRILDTLWAQRRAALRNNDTEDAERLKRRYEKVVATAYDYQNNIADAIDPNRNRGIVRSGVEGREDVTIQRSAYMNGGTNSRRR